MNKFLAQSNKSLERAPRLRSGTCNVPSQTVAGLIMNEPIDLLRSHFGLTPAEARLALHLVAGETLRSAAAQFNISYQTARTHLKNIFKKTGACRQAELVTVILTALPDCLKQLRPEVCNTWHWH
jgi:DNA-binding CsgD family transcriptional regulator